MNVKKKIQAINNVWIITREYDGLAGAGGVKDVCRQLAETLVHRCNVSVCLPMYGFINPDAIGFKPTEKFQVDMPYVGVERREEVRVWSFSRKRGAKKLTIYLIDAQRYREKRAVYTYTQEDELDNADHVQGAGHYDYFAMNVLLQKASMDLMLCLDERPDIIHCHDGHAALLPAMAREKEGFRHFFRQTGMVVTIHNAGLGYHQEVADLPFAKIISGLPSKIIGKNLLDGRFDPFLAAAPYAVLNTVSENYARELRETDDDKLTGWLGHALASRGYILQGVTNGITPEDFDPSQPEKLGIAASYSPGTGDFAGKEICRQDVIELINNKDTGNVSVNGSLTIGTKQPLFTFIGRLTAQKGVDKLVDALDILLPMDPDFQVLILGTGSKEIEKRLIDLAANKKNKGRIAILRGYDPVLANKVYAAGDFFLIPSQYEPCGLTDYIAQLFGNLPIVHHIGGLVKVVTGQTGFTYSDHSSAALMGAMQKALLVFRAQPDKIIKMRLDSIKNIHNLYTWDKIVIRYIGLYREALEQCAE